jgi:hypothetical protein
MPSAARYAPEPAMCVPEPVSSPTVSVASPAEKKLGTVQHCCQLLKVEVSGFTPMGLPLRQWWPHSCGPDPVPTACLVVLMFVAPILARMFAPGVAR